MASIMAMASQRAGTGSFVTAFSSVVRNSRKASVSTSFRSNTIRTTSVIGTHFNPFARTHMPSTRLFSDNGANNGPPAEERSEEEKAKIKAEREFRKAEKERKKAEKKAKKALQAAASAPKPIPAFDYLDATAQDSYANVGDYSTIMSKSRSGREFARVSELDASREGEKVWIRGRLASIRVKGKSCFLVIRQDTFDTLQGCFFKTSDDAEGGTQMLTYLKTLTVESVVDVMGTLTPATVKSCSVTDAELVLERIHTVSRAQATLPFLVEDAARPESEIDASQDTERPFPRLGQELRLDNRWMDLRTPAQNSILRIQSGICQLFREFLFTQDFIEIHTPKLIAGESETGAGVFTTDYFGTTACLAQSPQLYKQMAISGDLPRVFEVGPVFRAEKSNTRRHLCEFTGLDIEMAIDDHYLETLEVVHDMFKHIFGGLESKFGKELACVREQYESEPVLITEKPVVMHWPEAMDILEAEGFDVGDRLQDLTGAQELALGRVVRETYHTDFFMLDQYPSSIRPFYTMHSPTNPQYSNSYDMFLRGQEICSGAQRCHDPEMVLNKMREKGIDEESLEGGSLKAYVNSFRDGVSPHAGAGIGLERVVFLYLGLDNVRKASMFPRDPNRCSP